MDILNAISRCRSLVFQGFTSTDLGGLSWLKDVCIDFTKFCQLLRVFFNDVETLAKGEGERSTFRDKYLVCTIQIMKCVKCMERTIKTEVSSGIVLSLTRQHFLDRILWCLEKMEKSIEALENIPNRVIEESNFVDTMDLTLDLVRPFTMFSHLNTNEMNLAAHHAEVLFESAKIRTLVNDLIGNALTFANVAHSDDKKPLTAVCQTVLNECIAFEKLTSLDQSIMADISQRQIHATALENALYQLDGLVNDCLLRLVFIVLAKMRTKPLAVLSESVECEDGGLDKQIVQFDEMNDRLQQIGIFAAAFAPNQQDKNTILSALASAESLEPILVPSILSKSSFAHCDILCRHWTEEMTVLRDTIQHIIDSYAFCSSLCDHISQKIVTLQRRYDPEEALAIFPYCNVFEDHLRSNWDDLNLNETSTKRRIIFDKFVLMLSECKAAVDACSTTESLRVLKRFRILLGVLKKFNESLDRIDDPRHVEDGANFSFGYVSIPSSRINQFRTFEIMKSSSSLEALEMTLDAEDFFQSFGISRSVGRSILYSVPTRENTIVSQKLVPQRIIKKVSLRSKLFKRLLPVAPTTESLDISAETDLNQTMDLQITNILDQLTDLSTTLSNGI